MGKRIIIGSIVGIVIIGISVFYYFNRTEPVIDSIFRAVPLDASLLIDIKDYEAFRKDIIADNQLWKELSYLPFFDEVNAKLRFVDSLTHLHPDLRSLLSARHPLFISGHPSGKDDIQLVYYLKVEDKKDFDQLEKVIQGYEGKTLELTVRHYENETIRDISFPGNRRENFSFTWSHGLFMLSKSSILLENAIRQLSSQESLLNKKGLADIIKTAGKSSLVNFYLNVQEFPLIAQKFIHAKFKNDLLFLKDLGNWIELDLNLKSDIFIFNGFSISNGDKPSYEAVFKNQRPVKLEIFGKIPASAYTFAVLGINKYKQFQEDYMLLPESETRLKELSAETAKLKEAYNIDLIKNINDVFDQEAGVAFMGGGKDTLANEAFSVIKTKDRDDAEKMINGMVNDYSAKSGTKINSLVWTKKAEKDNEIKIWSVPFANIPALAFGNMFSASDNRFCTLSDNYLIFANSREQLVQYVQYLDQDLTISSDLEFNTFSDYFSSQSNFFFYCKPPVSLNFFSFFLKPEVIGKLVAQQVHYNKVKALVYQFNISDNNLIYHNLFIKYTARDSDKTVISQPADSYSTEMDGKIICGPFYVKGKTSKENEVLVQDDKNQLYLINPLGRIVWKTKLNDPVIGEIYPIDFYGNGKQQFLFNTRSQIFLLDKNGGNVEKFPVKLNAPATSGLAVFDYEKNRDYRIFVACNDRKIYAFDKKGSPLDKWKCNKTDSEVSRPVQYFRIEGKDILVFNDKQRLYMVDRKGKELATSKPIRISVNNGFSLINARSHKEARFLVTDNSGKIYAVALDGTLSEMEYGRYPENHWFDVYDVDGDGVKDFVYTWENNLKAITQKNKTILSISTSAPIAYRPVFMEGSPRDCKIGLVLPDEEKILLYDRLGKICKGFPLKGSTPFSIQLLKNSENKFNLTVGCNNNLLYQYTVQ